MSASEQTNATRASGVAPRRGSRWRRWSKRIAVAVAVIGGVLWAAYQTGTEAMGARATGERLARSHASPQWKGDGFANALPRMQAPMLDMTWEWITGGSDHRLPVGPLPVERRARGDFSEPVAPGLRVTWLGHSTLLIDIDGVRALVDPVWGDRASPFTWAGPKRFYPPPLPLASLPNIDAVVISHDHYDHLDFPTIVRLGARPRVRFFVPLGVGAHLEHWGVDRARIVELDWWEEGALGNVRLVATPARHFSGRSMFMTDQDQTLWAGWAWIGPEHRVFYSGDTALHPEFADIGRRLGPFDVTLIESGAYNAMWSDVHLGPEQAVLAHRMLRGRLLVPVHWGLFDLALHGWTEPVERVLVAANAQGVRVATPKPGATLAPDPKPAATRWWPDVPWDDERGGPAYSSHVDRQALIARIASGF